MTVSCQMRKRQSFRVGEATDRFMRQPVSVRADGQALTLLRVSRSVVVRAGVMMTVVVMALLVVIAIVERLRGGNHQDHQYRECGC